MSLTLEERSRRVKRAATTRGDSWGTAKSVEPSKAFDLAQSARVRNYRSRWCNSHVTLRAVPTVHPRIALTRDTELDEALKVGASVLGPSQPTSRVARELILRGAKELLANPGPELDRWLGQRGATPAARSTEEMLAVAGNLGAPDPENPRPLSDALAEMRAEEDR